MDSHDPAWREVETWIRKLEITLQGYELLTWSHLTEQQRYEAYLRSVFTQRARSRPEDVLGGPGGPVSVEMTYDPVSAPARPVYRPGFAAVDAGDPPPDFTPSDVAESAPAQPDVCKRLRQLALQPDEPVFRNHRGMRLTRFGVRYLLRYYCTCAQTSVPALRTKRLHPHSIRHSTAVHLLRASVDIVTISQCLDHASVTTTHRYATVDLDLKPRALVKARPTARAATGPAPWRTDASVLEWLETI